MSLKDAILMVAFILFVGITSGYLYKMFEDSLLFTALTFIGVLVVSWRFGAALATHRDRLE